MARAFDELSSQSIVVPSAASINLGTSDFTVMAWVRFPAEPSNDSMIIGKRAGGFDADEGWELKINDGGNETFRWDVETDVTGRQRAEGTATGINDGNWHLIGGDHTDGTPSQLQLWYDGAVIGTKVANTPGTVDTVTPLVIAAAYNTPSNTNYLTGEIGLAFVCRRVFSLGEHQFLAAGFSPRFLNPPPCFLMELISRASPEPDIGSGGPGGTGGLFGTLENAPGVVQGQLVMYPRGPDLGQDTWFEPISALIEGQSAVIAEATRGRTAAATIAAQSSLTADINALVDVAALVQGQSALVADFSVDARAHATIAGQSTMVAAAQVDAHERAAVNGQSAILAHASHDAAAATTVVVLSTVAATAAADCNIATAIAGQSALASDISISPTVACQIDGQSTLAATAVVDAGLVAEIGAAGTLASTPSASKPLSATFTGLSGNAAVLSADAPISATLTGQSALTATGTRARFGAAVVAGQSAVAGAASAVVPLAAAISPTSDIPAALSSDVPIEAALAAQSAITARLRLLGERATIETTARLKWATTPGGGLT